MMGFPYSLSLGWGNQGLSPELRPSKEYGYIRVQECLWPQVMFEGALGS